MDNPISKESNSSIAMNKLKLSEDASKIVRAIKKLHVPNTTLTDSNDLGNGKRTLKLVNGIQLSCNIDKVKEEKANNEKVMTKNKNVLTVYQPSNKNTGKESVVEEDNVDVEKSDCHEKKDVISSEKNGIRKEDPDNQNNSSGSIEQQTLDQVVSGNSLKINTQKPAQINNSRTIVKPVKSSNGSDSCISERKEIVDDKCGNVSKLKEENCTRNPCDISSLTSLKCNSPVVFESTAKEEGMQKAVNKVVEKLLNELPTSDDTNVEEVKKFNGGDCRLYTELTKDSDSNKRIKYDSENEDGTPCAKTIEDKETNTHCELRMKIDLKRKQANYIDADEKTVDMITVKKVKIDSEVITDEGRKLACSIKNGKLLDTKDDEKIKDIKEDDKVKITRFSHKDIIAEVEKLARSLLTKQTRSEVGELRAKVLALEKKVDYWKRQCWHLQKEMTECNIGVQRANQNLKKNTSVMPIKISTRSVGLQVQQVQQVQHVQMGVVRAPTASIAPAPLPAVRRHDVIQPAKTVAAAIPPTVTPKLHPSVSVSILQPKPPNNIASNLLMTPITSPGNTVIPKVASVIAPTTVATVRSALDLQRKVQATTVNPVPMRLVANQAVKQVSPATRPALATVTPNAVKIIDLTADEDDPNGQGKRVARAFQFNTTQSAPLSNTTVTPVKTSTAITVSNQRPVTIYATPVSQAPVGTNQLLLTTPQSSLVRFPVTAIRTTNSTQPILTQSSVNPGSKVTYLVPTTGVVSRVPLLITQANSTRPLQNILQPLLMQRGTTLVPLPTTTGNTQTVKTVVTPVIRNSAVVTTTVPVLTSTTQTGVQMTKIATLPKHVIPVTTSAPVTPTTSTNTTTASTKSEVSNQGVVVSRVTPKHPAPLPVLPPSAESNSTSLKQIPPKPALKISKVSNGIVLSWNMNLNTLHADISCYQLFAYQETSATPNPSLWKKVGDVKALALPMACTLTQFVDGHKYHFAVRALDVHKRAGPFSDAGSIVLPSPSSSNTATSARV